MLVTVVILYNGWLLPEGGDFEALNYQPLQNLIQSKNPCSYSDHLISEPLIFLGAFTS